MSNRSESCLMVIAVRSASRLAAGSSPFRAAAMMAIARFRACSQATTVSIRDQSVGIAGLLGIEPSSLSGHLAGSGVPVRGSRRPK